MYTTHAGHYMRRTGAFYTQYYTHCTLIMDILFVTNALSFSLVNLVLVFILVACVKMFMPRFTLCTLSLVLIASL